MGLISAFFYGLLTDRVLLIDTYAWDQMPDLFCEPFSHSSWWTPLSLKQHLELSVKASALDYARRITSEESFDKRYAMYKYGMNEFFCGHTQLALESATWVYYSTFLYDVPAVISNPVLRKKAKRLFPDNEIAAHLTRFLLLPTNSVWAKIRAAAEARLSPTHTLVGMQIRDFGAYNAEFSRRARLCLEQFGVLPSPIPDTEPPPDSQPLPERQLAHWNVTSLLVTALHEQYYLELKEAYEGRLRGDGTKVSVVTESHDEREDHGLQQTQQALVEIWLLSFSHTLMISYMSTFGYVAAALSARRPIYLNIVQRPKINNTYEMNGKPICERAATAEPCLHRDPNYNCSMDPYGIGYGNGTVLQSYDAIRLCRDFSSGIILTHDPKPEYMEAVEVDGLLWNITLSDK